MYFDLTNEAQRQQFREYVERMLRKGSVVRLTDEKPRSLEQNSFFQLLVSYFASRTGTGTRWVRNVLVKQTVCPDVFVRNGKLRSSSDLTSDEMSTVISRFQFFALTEVGVDLPEPEEYRSVISAIRQVGQDRAFIRQPDLKWEKK